MESKIEAAIEYLLKRKAHLNSLKEEIALMGGTRTNAYIRLAAATDELTICLRILRDEE